MGVKIEMKMREITQDTQLYEAHRIFNYFSGEVKWTIEPVKVAKINTNSVYVTNSKRSHRYKIKGSLPAMLDTKYANWDQSTWLTDNPEFAGWQNDLIRREQECDKKMRDLWSELHVNEKERVIVSIKEEYQWT